MAPSKKQIRENSTSKTARGASEPTPRRFSFKAEMKMEYKRHLSSVREALTDPLRIKFGIPILMKEVERPIYPDYFFVICLSSGPYILDLLLRRDNLYVIGFKPQNSKVYYLFDEQPLPQIIPNSIKLTFTGSYLDLKISNPGNLNFNEYTVKHCIEIVSQFNHKNYTDETKNCIAVLIVAFSEAVRFDNIANFIFKQMKVPQNKSLGSENLDQYIHNWASLSRKILDNECPPDPEFLQTIKQELKMVKEVVVRNDKFRYKYFGPNETPAPTEKSRTKSARKEGSSKRRF